MKKIVKTLIKIKYKYLYVFILISTLLYPIPAFASQYTGTARAIVAIGSASAQCPQGWPLAHGYITQGVRGGTSHYRLYPGEQAIDLGGNASDTQTFATFSGKVKYVIDEFTPGVGYGRYVDIEGTCNGTLFTARWAHLSYIDGAIVPDSQITIGQLIGGIDSTGNSSGTHLHYSFMGLTMGSPYITQNPSSPICQSDDGSACGVFW